MKRSEWLIGINEPLSINWLLNDDELRVLYKKVFEHFWIAERLYYEKDIVKEDYFNIEEDNGSFIVTISDEWKEFFSDIQKQVAFSKERDHYVYSGNSLAKAVDLIVDYNNKVDINKQINIDNLETIDTNVISKIITELRWSSGTHMNNGKLIDKLEKLIENFKKKQERLNNEIPSNYNGETFKNNKIDFLKGPFYERLKHMQSEDLPSYVIPIVPSRIDLLQENTNERVLYVKNLIIESTRQIQDSLPKLSDIKDMNWLLSNKSLAFLFCSFLATWYINRDIFEWIVDEKDTSSYKNAEQSINNKISLRKKSYKVRKYIQKHALKMEYTNNFMLDPIVKKAISMFFRNEKFFYTADINYQINNDSANIVIIYSVWNWSKTEKLRDDFNVELKKSR